MTIRCPHCQRPLQAPLEPGAPVLTCPGCAGRVPAPAAGHFIGIDLGTANTSAAWVNPRTGQAEVIRIDDEEQMPTVAHYGADGRVQVGRLAERAIDNAQERGRVISSVKRELASNRLWPVAGAPGQVRHVAPVEVAAAVLGKVKGVAEARNFRAPVTRAVLTCPAQFTALEKDRLKEAARLAGLDAVILEEPVAAAIAYARGGCQVGRHILVYDLGGGTFDLALLTQDEEDVAPFHIALPTRGDRVGGDHFDRAIYDHLEAEVRREWNCGPLSPDPDRIDLFCLRKCRQVKEDLCKSGESLCTFTLPVPGVGDKPLTLERGVFESLIQRDVERTIRHTQDILAEARASRLDVSSVLLIGGSSGVPLISRLLSEVVQVPPQEWHLRHVAVALGAAHYAHLLWGEKPAPVAPEKDTHAPPMPPAPVPIPAPAPPADPIELAQERCSQALADMAQATQCEEDSPDAGRLLVSALRWAEAACDLAPGLAEPFHIKGQILQRQGDLWEAAVAYTEALKHDPQLAGAYGGRGQCRLLTGNARGAHADLDQALRQPCELYYRFRAAAHWRLGNPQAAVADINSGLAVADADTPDAALHAVLGLILRDAGGAPAQAMAAFARSLQLLEEQVLKGARPPFIPICDAFGLTERWTARGKSGGVNPRRSVQVALWQTSQAVHGARSRAAVAEFVGHLGRQIDNFDWENEPEFALHMASLHAQKNDPDGAMEWLQRLLKADPAFDIRRAQADPWIRACDDDELRDFLTPTWSFDAQHNVLSNHLIVRNRSDFRLTDVEVTLTVVRFDRSRRTARRALEQINAGASRRWGNIFSDAGLLGGNITRVEVELRCAQGETRQHGAKRPKPRRRDEPRDERLAHAVVVEDADLAPRPARLSPGQDACPHCGTRHAGAGKRCRRCGGAFAPRS